MLTIGFFSGAKEIFKRQPVFCNNGSIADWAGCDHENITQSIKIKSCCKGGYCFVKEAEYPEDAAKYLIDAQKLYNHKV